MADRPLSVQHIAQPALLVEDLDRTAHVKGAWHLHPRDTHGVLVNLANPTHPDEHGMWTGWAWRQYVETNCRVVLEARCPRGTFLQLRTEAQTTLHVPMEFRRSG